ncbi:CPBP family intramembrane metalloprotease [Paenibacillus psychroresistens]|uniref:CPBP family intramembrane metalloprotease n=1 Tax=Paenibacillus psychroresistens TaxID=1778678 RepID=A0A6B8RMZ6_9BACL|nr:type II CAAX endopeptidase family protein [Paenibacillus psychroresistens]QGQ96915.1 CPBP family intramembrane metalloprotease [Paenibacillus psychroresistens]
MKKWNLRKFKLKTLDINEISDRMLLMNLYITQALTVFIGVIILFFQRNNIFMDLKDFNVIKILAWGIGYAGLFLAINMILSRFVPEDVSDDGGVNDKLFGNRPLWHIFVISTVVAICEEILFRGAIQHAIGAYWTSILFAAIHIRYLKHWIMTALVFGVSYGLGWIYIQTGSLWTPIVAHLVIDLVMGCIIRFRKDKE